MKKLVVLAIFGLLANVYGRTTSCVGYVKSEIPVDLTKIQVKLFTDRGNLKYETECNPSDGFYTIPIYNPGKYKIKVIAPDGWQFENNLQNIEIFDDSTENACKNDINFVLFGFSVSGVVRSGNASGPNGFSLALYEAKSGAVIARTTTAEGGSYEFTVKPGDYMISTEDRSAQCIDRGKVNVRVQNSPIRVSPDIQISGYNLKVTVLGEDSTPLSGATVALFSSSKLQLDNIPVNAQRPQIVQQQNGKWSSILTTDVNGIVHFYCLPPQSYTLQAAWQMNDIQLNFETVTLVDINFDASEVIICAVSFNINGKLSNADAMITLNGESKALSDSQGRFTLTDLTTGLYKISAIKNYYKFEEKSIKLSGSADTILPKLEITRLAVCGTVDFDRKFADVQLTARSTESSNVVEITVDQNTKEFCTYLAPGTYVLEMSKSPRYSFSPATIPLKLKNEPVLNLRFTQFKATISGEVKCFESCKDVSVQLWQSDEIVSEQSCTGPFKFVDVVPSLYMVKIRDARNFWWNTLEHTVAVSDANVKDISFKQIGYKALIYSSHACVLNYVPISSNNSELKAELHEGTNAVFFPQSGRYSFTVSHSCHKFGMTMGNSTFLQYLTVPGVTHWSLSIIQTQISAFILLRKPVKDVNFHLMIKSENGDEFKMNAKVVLDGTNHSFIFYMDQKLSGQQFTIIPKSDKYIFWPSNVTFIFSGECLPNIAVFDSEIGKVINGNITPAVSGVAVTLTNKNGTTNVLSTVTDASGVYSIGGIWKIDEWKVNLYKEGYEFKPIGGDESFDFRSVKLSYMRIDFVDIDTAQPLSEVLVSISGPNNYRSSSVVDSSGTLIIIGLASGEYFVRPILQEYKFNATSISFQIKEGESKKLTLHAKKFAYSAFGKITSISKEPIQEIVNVEAVSEKCDNHQEEFATSPVSSNFRIRGLRPDCSYRLTLKDDLGQRLSSYPPFIDVVTGATDKHDIDFIVTPAESQTTVFSKIDFSEVHIRKEQSKQKKLHQQSGSSYHIVLLQRHTGKTIQEIDVEHPTSVFLVSNLKNDGMNYSIGIERSETKKHGIEPAMVDFSADSTFKYIKLTLRSEKRVAEVEVLCTNFFGLMLLAIIALWFLNQSKAQSITERVIDYARTINNAGADGFQYGEDSSTYRKRKAKK